MSGLYRDLTIDEFTLATGSVAGASGANTIVSVDTDQRAVILWARLTADNTGVQADLKLGSREVAGTEWRTTGLTDQNFDQIRDVVGAAGEDIVVTATVGTGSSALYAIQYALIPA